MDKQSTGSRVPKQEETIDLLDLAQYLLKKWIWLALALIIGCALAVVLYHFTVTPVYKADSEIYITNTDTVINIQDVQLSSQLTVDYEQIILSRTVLKKVIKDQQLDIDYKTLKSRITVSNPSDSHCLIISATGSSPEEAINITNSLVRFGIDQIYRTVGKDEPSVIDAAEADAVTETQASVKKYAAIGGMAGLVAAGGFFVLVYLLDTTLKTNDDIEKYLGLNVLAVVPESEKRKKK